MNLAPKLKGGASQKVVGKLLSERLVEEIAAGGSLPVWRRDEDKGALALRITERGLAAIRRRPLVERTRPRQRQLEPDDAPVPEPPPARNKKTVRGRRSPPKPEAGIKAGSR